MYFIMFLFLVLLTACGFYALIGRFIKVIAKNKKSGKVRIIRAVVAFGLSLICYAYRTLMMVALYLFIIFWLSDILARIIRRILKKFNKTKFYKTLGKINRFGIVQFIIVAFIIGYGVYNMNNLVATNYTVTSNKISEDFRVVFLSDIHYNTTQSPDVLKKQIPKINSLKPDLVILGGDILEEGTSNNLMKECFAVLGGIKSRFGNYYIYGNHDRQTYAENPEYTADELKIQMALNSIYPLKEKSVEIGNEILIIGREDSSVERRGQKRASTSDLIGERNERFVIVADHQPTEFNENAAAGVDLQLSGHTHGGQIFPLGFLGERLGLMNQYGEYNIGSFNVIVSSGVAGWGFNLRTEKHSEIVVVDILPEKQ